MRFEPVPRTHEARPAVERLVTSVFRDEYGASLRDFPAQMFAVFDRSEAPQCAAVLRDRGAGFLSEKYLNRDLDRDLSDAAGAVVQRDDIIELGLLAAPRPGALLCMLHGFAQYGLDTGHGWVVYTATDRLRHLARRVGVDLIELGAADPSRLADPAAWGTYYENDPRVCAVRSRDARDRLTQYHLPCGAEPAPSVVA